MIAYRTFGPGAAPADLYRFRYSVYVEEMRRPQKYACHEERTIIDPLDKTATNIVAFNQDEIVGCVRINFLRDGGLPDYEALYALDSLNDRHDVSICTRLMIKRSRRLTVVTVGVMKCVYEFALMRDITVNYLDCNAHLVGFFAKFGYEHLFEARHEEYGDVSIMRLDLLDYAKLSRIRSPFAPICAKRRASSAIHRTQEAAQYASSIAPAGSLAV